MSGSGEAPELSSDEEAEGEGWREQESAPAAVRCLFCPELCAGLEAALRHGEAAHGFRLEELRRRHRMDDYSYIKLVNYIKTHRPAARDLMAAPRALWDHDAYLQPVDQDEWLTYDASSPDSEPEPARPRDFHANVENGLVTLSEGHFAELQRTIRDLTEQVKEKNEVLRLAREDMETMRRSMKVLVDGTEGEGSNDELKVDCVSKVALEDDEGYFNSYAHFSIHHAMLSDKVRTESYKKAILENRSVITDSIVLDLGCGTGILSMLAATAGAKTVYALDQSDIVYHAMDIVRENNLHDTIKVIKGRLENTKLEQKVDIIISEWMGYFLLFEGMLDSVIFARDNYLKPNGRLFPNRCDISLVASGDVETHNNLINFWSDVYGYKMNCMKSEVVREASIDIVDPKHIITKCCIVKEIDINTCTTDVMDFSAPFSLPVIKDGILTSLVGYFDTFFDLPSSVAFSTGPDSTPTHWKQTVFYFKDCRPVKEGEVISGTISCNRNKTDVRALSVHIELYGKLYKFLLS